MGRRYCWSLAVSLAMTAFLGTGPTAEGGDSASPAPLTELSRAEAEALVRGDLAQRLRVVASVPRLVEATSRTWLDRGLGCTARHGLEEPARVPGYRFVFEVDRRQYTYHADRAGRFVRCQESKKKRLDPMIR